MLWIKRTAAFAFLLSFMLTAAGCFSEDIDGLYSLPQQSEKHLKLQELINEEINAGSEFSAPTRGSFRQSVQQYDLNGDGADESLAFFLDADKTLKICIYRETGEEYELAATIKGEGVSIGSVEYADLDADGFTELIVTWQSGDMRILQVYTLRDFNASTMLLLNCNEFIAADIDKNDRNDLLVLRYDGGEAGEDGTGLVEMYDFLPGEDPVVSSASLSAGLEAKNISRIRMGELSDGAAAMFIEGVFGQDELITDILTCVNGKLVNVSLDEASGVSRTRRFNVKDPYSRDIDNDRAMETPETVALPSQPGISGTYWVFDWFTFDSGGGKALDISTYHSSDGWYLILPEQWRRDITVRREESVSGERVVVLSVWNAESEMSTDVLVIYTLTGDNRRDRTRPPNRFIIYGDDTTIYAGKLLPGSEELGLSQEEVKSRFKLIYSEWTTGAL